MNYHKEVIEIISIIDSLDKDKILVLIAKENPSAIVKACRKLGHKTENYICAEILERGDKIGAIKKYREMTGADLKESRRAIEDIESKRK